MNGFAWNGKYYVTIRLPSGRVIRQSANKPLPKGCITIIGTDNGMQPRDKR